MNIANDPTRPAVPALPPAERDGSTWHFLQTFVRSYPARTALMVLLLVLSGTAEGIGLVALLPLLQAALGQAEGEGGLVTDTMARVGLTPSLGLVLTFIAAMMFLKAALLWLAMRQVGYTAARVATALRRRLIRALTLARWQYVSSQPTGYLTTAISGQANRSASAYADACGCLADLIQATIYFLIVCYISPPAAFLALVSGILIFFILGPFIRMTRRAGMEQTKTMKRLVARLTEIVSGVKPIKAMGREEDVWPMLERETDAFQAAQRKVILARGSVATLFEPFGVTVVVCGLYFALTYELMPLTELAVIAVIFYRAMNKAGTVQQRYQNFVSNESAFHDVIHQIKQCEAARETAITGSVEPVLRDRIELRDVHVAFGDKMVIDGIDATIDARTLTAVTGPSGAGKTTLVDVVLGLRRPERGEVLIDGTPVDTLPTIDWRARIGYVPQEVLLFHDTVRQNVTLGRSGIADTDVVRALRAAGAWDFISSIPDGLDHVVGERGGKLSGGQRQRIAIARALLGDPQILVLDEATAALDPITEAGIIDTMIELRARMTILAISHQPAMAKAADTVLTLDGGKLSVARHGGIPPADG
jgi:ATP-binding cassette subfamily C protein